MKTAFALGWGFLKKQVRSSALLLGTVVLSAAFLVCMCLVGSGAIHTAELARKNTYGSYKAAVWGVETDMETLGELYSVWTDMGRVETYAAFAGVDGKLHLTGRADGTAVSLLNLRLISGNMPQAPGEAVFEACMASQLGLESIAIGDRVELELSNGETLALTVCGIAENYSAVKHNAIDPGSEKVLFPSVLVFSGGTPIDTVYLLDADTEDFWTLGPCLPPAAGEHLNTDAYPGGYATGGFFFSEEVGITLGTIGLVGGIIAVCTATVMLNGFLMSVDKRQRQMSLLRCIGATKKQAMSVICAEGLILLGLGLPVGTALGVGISFFAVRIFGLFYGAEVIWHFAAWPIPLAVAICSLCVVLSTLIPAFRAGKQPPIVAARPALGHKRRKKGIGRPLGTLGLTGVNLMLSGGRTLITALTFSLVILLCGSAVLITGMVSDTGYAVPDVKISPESTGISYEGEELEMHRAPFYVNYRALTRHLSLPRELPERLVSELETACTWSYIEPRFAVAVKAGDFDDYLNGFFIYESEKLPVPEGNMDGAEDIVGLPSGKYPYLSDQVSRGFEKDEYLLETYIFSVSDELLSRLSANVISGRIDVDAISRGDEVVLTVPNYEADYSNYPYGQSFRILGSGTDSEYMDGTVFQNTNWTAGDKLALTWVDIDLNGQEHLVRREVTVGATVKEGLSAYGMPGQVFGLYVGAGTLNAIGAPHTIRNSSVYFPTDVEIEDGEKAVLSWLEENYPSVHTKTLTEVNRAEQQNKQLITGIVGMVVVCLVSLGTLGLVNTASVRIHSRSHSLGLLRSIGMTKGQIILMLTAESAAIGLGACGVGLVASRVLLPLMEENWRYPALGPALGLACLGTVVLAVATVFVPALQIMRKSPTEIISSPD